MLGALAEAIAEAPGAILSAIFPGRLVDGRSLARPRSLLHTSYEGLARRVVAVAESRKPTRAIVGLDSRLFACARAFATLEGALMGGT